MTEKRYIDPLVEFWRMFRILGEAISNEGREET